ncbi:aspartate aminotransferase family protein [Alkalihalophilus pseudofirmus]|uniref:glutamate-1-semialdehyde 2,1-aminomutase n=1 Tax=Alkalihalophilus pseudofirmus TaxID=79885 RepID=A0AAJ2U304_ALKPS|nr:aspartate aminotransferase family protein [Alkalihalophilus pseudofirmus]MDV2885722.1 aspartate aminotransferase family protein [Alkalihalophilus pseudofirmus]
MSMTSSVDEGYRYMERTLKSQSFMNEASEYMPGGVTANIKYFTPHPIVMNKAKGAYVYDVDGNEYVDYLLSYGALKLGHGHEAITKAIGDQLEEQGTCLFGTPHHYEVEMAKQIKQLYPSMENIRYTNSGTEATLLALRLARAYTGKEGIAKFEGHYHGGFDEVLVSVNPSLEQAGPEQEPNSVLESKGMSERHKNTTITLPFNDLASCEEILRKKHQEIGAVIIEPLQGGFIRASQSFIEGMRQLTKEFGILFIFDEVKTGFRVALGGAQELYEVQPDLTTLGKVIGGGFPVGIVGGRKEIMNITSPSHSADVFDISQSQTSNASDVLFHSGTYNGHPTILACGLATLEVLKKETADVCNLTSELKTELEHLFKQYSIPMLAVGEGSIFNIVITDKKNISHYRDLQASDFKLRKKMDLRLLLEGIYTKPLNRYSVSTAHTAVEVEKTIEAFRRVLNDL